MRVLYGLLAGALLLLPTQPMAEEKSVNALAAWLGSGQLFKVSPEKAYFAGRFEGAMFISSKDGKELNAAQLTCPGNMDISLSDGHQAGTGHCIITSAVGEVVYGAWTCEGVAGAGCAGDFTLTGGTGQFEGITGGGKFVVRSALHSMTLSALDAAISETALGVAVWTDLTYTLK